MNPETVLVWIAGLLPAIVSVSMFVYGIARFFRKGIALNLVCVTMAMGCHALGDFYTVCQLLSSKMYIDGFTPAYLGRAAFVLFFITASYGQLDKILDDGSKAMRPARIIALAAPLTAFTTLVPYIVTDRVPFSTRLTFIIFLIPAAISMYFNLKHAIIPDMGFGFIKAIRPFNILSVALVFSELLLLTAWNCYSPVFMVIAAVIFSLLCTAVMIAAKKGVEQWTI